MQRRSFLKRTATLAGAVACTPVASLCAAHHAPETYVGRRYRSIRGHMHPVTKGDERVDDYVVFSRGSESSDTAIDLFVCANAPEGHDEVTILEPLGRHAHFKAARRVAARHARQAARHAERRAAARSTQNR